MGRDIKKDPFLWGLENAPNNFEKIKTGGMNYDFRRIKSNSR